MKEYFTTKIHATGFGVIVVNYQRVIYKEVLVLVDIPENIKKKFVSICWVFSQFVLSKFAFF